MHFNLSRDRAGDNQVHSIHGALVCQPRDKAMAAIWGHCNLVGVTPWGETARQAVPLQVIRQSSGLPKDPVSQDRFFKKCSNSTGHRTGGHITNGGDHHIEPCTFTPPRVGRQDGRYAEIGHHQTHQNLPGVGQEQDIENDIGRCPLWFSQG